MYVLTKYIATIIIKLLSQLYIYVNDVMPYTLYTTSTLSYPSSLPTYSRLTPISGPQLAGLHSTSHAYQLYQRANKRGGWTAGIEQHHKRNSLLITRTQIKIPRSIVKRVLCSSVTGLALEVWRYCIYYKITIYQQPSNFSYTLPPL